MDKNSRVLELFYQGKSNKEIGSILGIKGNTVSYYLKRAGVTSLRTVDKRQFKELYDNGFNDAQIARKVNCSTELVRHWRLDNNLPSTFDYKNFRACDFSSIEKLVGEGCTDREVAEILGISEATVYRARTKVLGLNRKSYAIGQDFNLTFDDYQLLVGTLMGDGNLHIAKDCVNPVFSCEHGYKQREYAYYKYDKLSNLNPKFREYTRNIVDERNGIFYKSAVVRSPTTPSLLSLYYAFYGNGKKTIPFELLDKYYTAYSLAIHFMDDGTLAGTSYLIATQSFSTEDVKKFRLFLLDRFQIESSVRKTNNLYILARSGLRFATLVFPHILPSLMYKLYPEHVRRLQS